MVWIVLFLFGGTIVFYAMVGYPLFLMILRLIIKPESNRFINEYEPTVSFMIVAHNEEAVILQKLKNAVSLDYPTEKLQIIVASDNSTDRTNNIVEKFIETHQENNILLYCSKDHKGKTNAQNEAQKQSTGEILVMTDANTILKRDAIRELVSYFSEDDIVYVCGKLEYTNSEGNSTSNSESTYWDFDMQMRDIESRIKTITAGNGALYAIKNECYIDYNPIYCHDSIMPFTYGKEKKRALFNPNAIAYEKAGETNEDEYKRKVRMNRDILDMLSWGLSVLNPIKYGWFGVFYFGHRTCRYLVWLAHIMMLVASFGLAMEGSIVGIVLTVGQVLFFVVSLVTIKSRKQIKLGVLHLVCYYGMTVIAQMHGVVNIITGKAKPVWEKAESTR